MGPSAVKAGNFSDSSWCWIRWYSLRLAGTGGSDGQAGRESMKENSAQTLLTTPPTPGWHSLNSPLHCQAIFLWQFAPGLLKSQAAQVASSTMAEGWGAMGRQQLGVRREDLSPDAGVCLTCRRFVRMMFGYMAPTSRW